MRAAIPASGWARRGCSRVLLVQAKLGVATARSGGASFGRFASVSAAASTGSCSSSPATAVTGSGRERVRRLRACAVMLNLLKGGPGRARGGGVTRGQCAPTASTCDVHGMPMPFWARDFRRVVVASSTRVGVGVARVVRWRGLARWPGQEKKGERGGASGWRHGRHGHALACPPLSLGLLCIIKGEREPGDQVE